MKKILFLLLLSIAGYGQTSTGQEQSFPYGIVNESLQTITTPTYIGTFGTDGTQGKIPSAYIAKTAAVQDSLNKKLNLPTGFLQGLQLSINADPTKFNIATGYYVVTDFTNLAQPVVKIINYAGATGLTPAYLATANSTYVALDINGTVISSASPFTDAQRRTLAIIGNVVHSNHTTINVTNEIKAPIVAIGNQLHDFMRAIGFLNESGNIYSANGANLQINKSVGDIFGMGINAADYLSPHKLTIPSQTALTFAYRFQNGTQLADTQNINPNIYDVAGVSTPTPSNKWTIQRINLFQSGLSRIQPGQTVYNSFNDAVVALPTQPFVTEQNIADNAVFRCYLIVQEGTTNLASAVAGGTAQFVPVDKFGNIIGNGSVALTYSNIVAALGFAPENQANKSDSYTDSSSTTYASTKAVVDGLENKAPISGSANYIQNQNASAQSANMWISGNARVSGIATFGGVIAQRSDNDEEVLQVFQNPSASSNMIISYGDGYIGWKGKTAAGANRWAFESSPNSELGRNFGLYLYDSDGSNGVKTFGATRDLISTISLSVYGTANVSNSVTANSFIKSGGTSSQFLKADGSVDSTIYAADDSVVHITGSEEITGNKFFSGSISTDTDVTISGGASLKFNLGTYSNSLNTTTLTANRTIDLPNASGTVALVETVRPYKVYTALLSQTGTSAPTATVLENTLGGTVVWTRNSSGAYLGTLSGVFTLDKTVVFVTQGLGTGTDFQNGARTTSSTVQINSFTYLGVATDGLLNNTSIEIRVYN